MISFGKNKALEERIAQLEQELNEVRQNAEQELQAERDKCAAEVERCNAALQEATDALTEEKARYEEAISDLKQQHDEAMDEQKARSDDALIALREHIYAEKADLMKRSEKEISIETLLALSGFGGRMERLERRYADLLKSVNNEVNRIIGAESANILNGFRDAKAEMLGAFTEQSESLRTEYDRVNKEALQALSADTETAVSSIRQSTAQILEDLAQKSEALRGEYSRINEESTQALSANSQAVVGSFRENTAQLLETLTQKSEALRGEYGRINQESTQALSANSQAVVGSFRENTAQMMKDLSQQGDVMRQEYNAINVNTTRALSTDSAAILDGFRKDAADMSELVKSLKLEIAQAARDAVEAINEAANANKDSALSKKLAAMEAEISSIRESMRQPAPAPAVEAEAPKKPPIRIQAVRLYEKGYMLQPFALGGEGTDGLDPAVRYRSSLQNYVIDTGSEVILVDTGMPDGVPNQVPDAKTPIYMGARIRDYLPALAELGYGPDDVSKILVTHKHTDHTGLLAAFPKAVIYASAEEAASQELASLPNVKVVEYKDGPYYNFEASERIADGIVFLPAKGHTKGNSIVIVEDGGLFYMIQGDVTYTDEALYANKLSVAFEDVAAARQTLDKVRAFVAAHPTVYLSTHTPLGIENLENKAVVDLNNPPESIPPTEIAAAKATGKYICSVCGYVYDPAEHGGVAFEDLPKDWKCPRCKKPKDRFSRA